MTYRLVTDGDDGISDPTLTQVAGRVVTEALTNALKYAPGAPVTVVVQSADGGLTVTVENSAPSQDPNGLARAGGGFGLPGLRDRVLANGGCFDAGPTGDGGWRVRAAWPALPRSLPSR